MRLTYTYKANPAKMALGGLFFGACGALFVYLTMTNDRGVVIDGVIELGPEGATVLYGVLAFLAFGFVFIAVASTLHGVIRKPVLVLTEEHIALPASFLRPRPRTIRFVDIARTAIQQVSTQRFLTIWATTGKISIVRSLLESDAAFEEIVLFVRDHTSHLSGAPPSR